MQRFLEVLFLLDSARMGVMELLVSTVVPLLISLVLAAIYSTEHHRRVRVATMARLLAAYAVSASLLMVFFTESVPRALILIGLVLLVRPRRVRTQALETVYGLWAVLVGVGCGLKYFVGMLIVTCFLATWLSIQTLWRRDFRKSVDAL